MHGFKGHNIIIGMTGSGKSSLLKWEIIPKFRKRGIKSAVLDPLGDPGFGADWQTKNPDQFLAYAFKVQNHILIVDEGGQAIGRYNKPMLALATTVRHRGNFSFFVTHGVTDLSKTIREQCANVFLFACSRDNFEMIADRWDQPELLNMPRLDAGQFYFVPRFGQIVRGHIDFSRKKVSYGA